MSPRLGRRAKLTSRHSGRHAGPPRQAQPLSLAPGQGRPGLASGRGCWRCVCAAGHSRRRPGQPGQRRRGGPRCGNDRRPRALIIRAQQAAARPACTVICGVTLPGISARVLRHAGRLPGLRQPRPDLHRAGHHLCLPRHRGCFCLPLPSWSRRLVPGPGPAAPDADGRHRRHRCRPGRACENGLPREDRTGYAW